MIIQLGAGFTALLGPNNSGKSSFLRMLWELRALWSSALGALPNAGANVSINYTDVPDPEEIFSHQNNRDIEIRLDFFQGDLPASVTYLSAAVMTASRSGMNTWAIRFELSDPKGTPIGLGTHALKSNVLHTGQQGNIDCSAVTSVLNAFINAYYIGPFRNAISEATATYFDLAIGTSFIASWDQWKNGTSHQQMRIARQVTSDLEHIFEFDRLEINASVDGKTLNVLIDGQPYRLQELGAGLSQFIIVLANTAMRRPSLVLIDEPELSLHPSLQIDFLTSLASYATEGIVFATHSVGLARTTAEHIFSFRKESGRAVVRPFEQLQGYAEFLGELSFSTFKDLGFDCVLLVEGVKDVKTVQQFLRFLHKDHKVVIIPLGGDELAAGNAEHELGELRRLSDRVFALVDSEREREDATPIQARLQFMDVCKKLGITVCVTERRALENYLSDTAVKQVLGSTFSALGPYELLSAASKPWGKDKNWRIARAMSLQDIESTDVGRFLASL